MDVSKKSDAIPVRSNYIRVDASFEIRKNQLRLVDYTIIYMDVEPKIGGFDPQNGW